MSSETKGNCDEIIKNNKVVVFTSSTCPYCVEAISELKKSSITFKEVVATSSQREWLKNKTGQSSVPSGWINGEFIGGCNDGPQKWMGILPLLKNGKFEEKMKS